VNRYILFDTIEQREQMYATFDKFLEPIRNKSLSLGQRHFYAIREITLTNQTNAEL